MKLVTPRLCVREFCSTDLDDLQAILGDEQTMAYVEPVYTRERTERFLKTFCMETQGALAAAQRESGRVIGYVLFHAVEPDVYEIGWIFRRACWRQGYAYEACAAVIRFAFEERGARRVFAETVDPIRSVGLMKKLGMHLEDVRRGQAGEADLYLYGRLRTDFEN